MPQMKPMNWSWLFTILALIYVMSAIMMFYERMSILSIKLKMNKPAYKITLKW